MATGRVTKVRARAGALAITGRISKLRAQAIPVVATLTGRITKVRSQAVASAVNTYTVEPFATVTLGSGTWTQTDSSGFTATIVGGNYAAPASPTTVVQTFTKPGGTATVTTLPHTLFGIGTPRVGVQRSTTI